MTSSTSNEVNEVLAALASAASIAARCAIVSPHPDDETIGAGGVLWRMRELVIICLTDGAPFDSSLWPARYPNRETYAAIRRRELSAALEAGGATNARVTHLDCVDQTCATNMFALAHEVADCLFEARPDVVLVTPYEGGHPDHDSAALVARAAIELLHRRGAARPLLVEMTSYHCRAGRVESGEFLGGGPSLSRTLNPRDQARKRRMFSAHASQAAILTGFGTNVERFRAAPAYDFTKPPHSPPLHYENLGWPMTARRWCELAEAALMELGLTLKAS